MSTYYDMLYTRYQREIDAEADREAWIEQQVDKREREARGIVLDILAQHGANVGESLKAIEQAVEALPDGEDKDLCWYYLDEYPYEPLEEPEIAEADGF